MRLFSNTQLSIINLLANGLPQSGTLLGKKLGITRTAIWKNIKQLNEMGLPIQTTIKGYQLDNFLQPLNEQAILNFLKKHPFNKPIQLHLLASVDSTNQYLKLLPASSMVEICSSEMQTQGKGRFGRKWYSPFSENINLSIRYELNCCPSKLAGLSLLVGLSLLRSLKDCQILEPIQLKWPNDLMWCGKKLGGILIEIMGESHATTSVVIGIGLNVNSNTHLNNIPQINWCSLYEITKLYQDRNLLIASMVSWLNAYLDIFLSQGFESFLEEWKLADYLLGKNIQLVHGQHIIHGKALGINELGQLLVEDDEGVIQILSSGETSLHQTKSS